MKHHARQHPSPEAAAPAPAAAEGAPAAAAAGDAPATPEALAELRSQVEDWKDKALRARADLENYRRRVQREMAEIRGQERAATLRALLSVHDHFQMARGHLATQPDLASLQQGVAMIADEFAKALASLQVEPFDDTGQPFDPTRHEAVSQEPSGEVPAGHVLRQWKPGYRMGEQLLRPAVVVVSSGAPAPAAAAAPEQPSGAQD